VIPKKVDSITTGEVIVSNKAPKSFPYLLSKGDTMHVSIGPLRGKAPTWKIVDPLGEYLHAELPSGNKTSASVTATVDGQYKLEVSAPGFRWLPVTQHMSCVIEVIRSSPKRFALNTEQTAPAPLVDSVMEVFLDTTITLGAQRDPIHSYKLKLPIVIPDLGSVLKCGVLYGAGGAFLGQLSALEEQWATKTDVTYKYPLAEYCIDPSVRLPTYSNGEVSFRTSDDLSEGMNGRNFGIVNVFQDESSISMLNTSPSIQQTVRVMVVLFRCNQCPDG
jgi:hypothetical protein